MNRILLIYLQWSSIRYAMTDHLIHRCATRCREIVVIHWAWIAISLDACLMHDTIDFVGSNSYVNRLGSLIQHFAAQFARNTHRLNFLVVQHFDSSVSCRWFKSITSSSNQPVAFPCYTKSYRGNSPRWPTGPVDDQRNRVEQYSQALCESAFAGMASIYQWNYSTAMVYTHRQPYSLRFQCPLEWRKKHSTAISINRSANFHSDLLPLTCQGMDYFVRFPVAFEAVLVAEERAMNAQFQACRTLQCGRFEAIGRLTFITNLGWHDDNDIDWN